LSLFLFLLPVDALAQYRGEPVQRDRLINVLRSKRFQSRDIVQIITENGVDFKLTPATQNELVAAGARPVVIDAVRKNYRNEAKPVGSRGKSGMAVTTSARPNDYNSIVNEAVEAYDVRKNKAEARTLLDRAVALQPGNPRAHQLLGFLSLYGNKDFDEAESHWKKSISLGGNAVLRVIHDHDGSFLTSCQGSLYISSNTLRFESDNNSHTFETSDRNIKKIEVNNKWRRLIQLKGGSFKVLLNKEEGETKYNFAPLSGKADESKMIIRLIGK
jgi:hypothetical protein